MCYDVLSVSHFEAFCFIKNYNEGCEVVCSFNFDVLLFVIWLHVSFDPTGCVNQLVMLMFPGVVKGFVCLYTFMACFSPLNFCCRVNPYLGIIYHQEVHNICMIHTNIMNFWYHFSPYYIKSKMIS